MADWDVKNVQAHAGAFDRNLRLDAKAGGLQIHLEYVVAPDADKAGQRVVWLVVV